jgi:uncharacterized membrane protein
MEEKGKGKTSHMHAYILWIVGLIALIAGVAVATVKGTHLRGSGLGTILIVVGVVVLIIGFLRFRYQAQK